MTKENPMNAITSIITPIAIIGVLGLVAVKLLPDILKLVASDDDSGKESQKIADSYKIKSAVLTPAELRFLQALKRIEMPGHRLIFKLRLADIFDVRSGRGSQRAFNRISQKHVDFLLIRESDSKPILGIELDDSTHQQKKRRERDDFVDQVFAASKIPLLHFPVRAEFDVNEIGERMSSALGIAAPERVG